MNERKLLIKEHKDLISVLYHLAKGQEILADTIYKMGDVDMDSRICDCAFEGIKEWKKNIKNLSKYLTEFKAILKTEEK